MDGEETSATARATPVSDGVAAERSSTLRQRARLFREEPRRGKTTAQIASIIAAREPAIYLVSNVGDTGDRDGNLTAARDLEDKILGAKRSGEAVVIIQHHGRAKCPAFQAWRRAQVSSRRVSRAEEQRQHEAVCGARTPTLDAVPARWRDGDIALADYDLLAAEGICPHALTRERARRLRPGEILVTTPSRARYLLPELIRERGALPGWILVADEVHRLTDYLVPSQYSILWHAVLDFERYYQRPPDMTAEAWGLVRRVTRTAQVALACEMSDRAVADARGFLFRLGYPSTLCQVEKKALQDLAIKRQDLDLRGFDAAFPEFDKLFASLPARATPDYAGDPLAPPRSREELLAHAHSELRHRLGNPDAYDFHAALAAQVPESRSGRRVIGDLNGPEDAAAYWSLKAWAENARSDAPMLPLVEFVLDVFDHQAVVIPLIKWADVPPRTPEKVTLHAVTASLLEGGIYDPEFRLLAHALRAGMDVRLLSATPPPIEFFGRGDAPTEIAVTEGALPAAQMTLVCENKARSSRDWSGARGSEIRGFVRELVARCPRPVVLFARNKREQRELQLLLQGTSALVYTARSFESQAVEIDPARLAVAFPARPPIDARYDRLFGPALAGQSIDPAGDRGAAAINLFFTIVETVQEVYRAARAGKPVGAIVLGCTPDFISALHGWLTSWGYECTQVIIAARETGPGAPERKIAALLRDAGAPPAPPPELVSALEAIKGALQTHGPLYVTELQRLGLRRDDGSTLSREKVTAAIALGLENGTLRATPGRRQQISLTAAATSAQGSLLNSS